MKNKSTGFSLRLILSLTSGILFIFAFPPFNLWQIAFFSLIPLLIASREKDSKNFLIGLIGGFTFYSISFFWLYKLAGPVYLFLALYLSIYWGLFLYLIFVLPATGRIFTAGALWFFLEIIISYLLTGFPWLLAGLSQWNNSYLIKLAGIFGIYGLSFIVISGNFTIFYSFQKRHFVSWSISVIIFVTLFFSHFPQSLSTKNKGETLKVMVVQPNIDSFHRNPEKDIEKAKTMTIEYLKKEKVDVIVWPEGIYPDIIIQNIDIINDLKKITKKYNVGIILGTFTGNDKEIFNSALLIEGENIQIYNKTHLVPYGEFIPGGRMKVITRIFEKMAGYIPYIKQGSELVPLSFRDRKIGVLICFENIFPYITATLTENEAELFVVITNDGWSKISTGPYQHFIHNPIRAVETGRYFIQSSLTGISGIISKNGSVENILSRSGSYLFIDGVIIQNIPVVQGKTLYSSFRDIPLFVLSVLITGLSICRKK
ncbi:MAG: apolipoprotein N-acyltransferase [bacterium]|nr:apolipoprotein N-acyltransferase [bacterium]